MQNSAFFPMGKTQKKNNSNNNNNECQINYAVEFVCYIEVRGEIDGNGK